MLIVCLPHAQVLVHRSDCLSLLNDCTACTYRSLSPRSINVCGTVVRVFHFLCEVSCLGGSNHDGIFFISRDKPNLVSGGQVHAQKCIFSDVLIPEN